MALFRRKPAPATDEAEFSSWGSALRSPVEDQVQDPAAVAVETTAPAKQANSRNSAEHLAAAKRAMAMAQKQRDDDLTSDPSQP